MTVWHDILWCAMMFAAGSVIAVISYILGHDAAKSEEERRRGEKFPD